MGKIKIEKQMTPVPHPTDAGEERSHPIREAQDKDQDPLRRDGSAPSLPTTRQGITVPQAEGHGHMGLLSPLCEPEDTYRQRADGFLTTCPFKIVSGELNEAGYYSVLFSLKCLLYKNKCFQRNISVTYFNDQ